MTTRSFALKTTVCFAAALSTIAPAAALARVAPAASPGVAGAPPQPTVEIVRVSDHGSFDWGDAGIGAAGGVGLSMLLVGGGLVLTGRRGQGARRSITATS